MLYQLAKNLPAPILTRRFITLFIRISHWFLSWSKHAL